MSLSDSHSDGTHSLPLLRRSSNEETNGLRVNTFTAIVSFQVYCSFNGLSMVSQHTLLTGHSFIKHKRFILFSKTDMILCFTQRCNAPYETDSNSEPSVFVELVSSFSGLLMID